MGLAGGPALLTVTHADAVAVAGTTGVPLLTTAAGEPAGATFDGIDADGVERALSTSTPSCRSTWTGGDPCRIGIVAPYTVQMTPTALSSRRVPPSTGCTRTTAPM
jgi:hypothetical protein